MFSFGGPQFGLAEGKIARWNSAASYGTAVNVPSIQVLASRLRTVSAELEGNDQVTATAAKAVSGDVTLRMGSIHIDVLRVLCGGNIGSSGSSPNLYYGFKVTNRKYPYIGIIGKANAEEGTGDSHLFIPKAKVKDGFEVRMEYGAFAIPEITLTVVADPAYADSEGYNPLFVYLEHQVAIPTVIPPVIPVS